MLMFFFKSMKSRWLELSLGIVVISAAVATLVVQRSVSASTEERIHELAHKLGKNMLVLPEKLTASSFYAMDYGDATMPESLAGKIRSSEVRQHIGFISERLYGNITVNGVQLVLVGDDRFTGGEEATIGEGAARRLRLRSGDTLPVRNDVKLKVKRVLTAPPEGLDVGVFVPLTVAQRVLHRPGAINAMRMGGCWCRLDVPTLAGKVERILPGTRAITIAGMLKAQKGTVASVKRYSVTIKAAAFGLITLMVVLLVSTQVRRQRREIGLLLALGSSPWRIRIVFLAQAALVALSGALLGCILEPMLTEYLTTRYLGMLPRAAASPPLALVGSVVAVSLAAAFFHSRRASRLDPTAVLSEV